jgi:hypothetical protein
VTGWARAVRTAVTVLEEELDGAEALQHALEVRNLSLSSHF